jgi:hypothetical protein
VNLFSSLSLLFLSQNDHPCTREIAQATTDPAQILSSHHTCQRDPMAKQIMFTKKNTMQVRKMGNKFKIVSALFLGRL